MSYVHPAWVEHQRRRWLRHDAHRFARPGATQTKSYAARLIEQRHADEQAAFAAAQDALDDDLARLRWLVADLKFDLAMRRLLLKYDPDQPRVPKGKPDGGQWTQEEGDDAGKEGGDKSNEFSAAKRSKRLEPPRPSRIPRTVSEWLIPETLTSEQQLAHANRLANDAIKKVQEAEPGWQPRRSLYELGVNGDVRKAKDLVLEAEARLVELGHRSYQDLIHVYRGQNNSLDLFGNPTWPVDKDVVSVTIRDGLPLFGPNADAPTYTDSDRRAADRLRDRLIESRPDVMSEENIGQMPNNALYHAETTGLLRAAKANGGTLEGQTLEVHVDDRMCANCERVLPLVGIELGNPTVTFVDTTKGARRTMKDGAWVARADR